MSRNRENADKLKIAPLGTVTDGNSSPITSDAVHDALVLKAPLANPTFTGTVVLPSTTSIGTVTNIELGYLDGVTSAIQTQFGGKIGATNYATDTTGGTVKVRLNGTVAYFTNNGNNA